MKIQTIFIFLSLSTFNLLYANCIENPFAKSELPKEMPENVRITFSENGGMAPTWHKIEITKGQIVVEDKKMNDEEPTKWFAEISDKDLTTLYQTFVENKFDLIKNDTQKGIVYDAGSESVRIRAGKISKSVSYGMNSPLSGRHLKRYSAAAGAIKKLENDYKSKATSAKSNFAVINYIQSKHSYHFNKGTRADINNIELELAESLLQKAISEFNEKVIDSDKIKDLDKYKHQLIGVTKANGDKEILINSFCSDEDQWQRELFDLSSVQDGGNCYFKLYVNLTKKTYRDFNVHGPVMYKSHFN